MKNFFVQTFALLALALVAGAQPVPPSTAFTRYLLTSTNQAQARERLGVAASGSVSTELDGPVLLQDAGGNLIGGYGTISNALAAATAGDTLTIGAGTYVENNLIRQNVNLHFEPGARLFWHSRTNDTDWKAMFDFRFVSASTNRITGFPDIYWSHGTNGIPVTNVNACVLMTNAAHDLYMEVGTFDGESYATNSGNEAYLVYQTGGNLKLDVHKWQSSHLLDTSFANVNSLSGYYWGNGRADIHFIEWGEFWPYAIWEDEGAGGNKTNHLIVTGNYLSGYVYASKETTNFVSWYDITRIERGTNGFERGAMTFLGGKQYVKAEKLGAVGRPGDASLNVIHIGPGISGGTSELFLDAQRVERGRYIQHALKVGVNSYCKGEVHDWLDTSTNVAAAMVNTAGKLYLTGGYYSNASPFLEILQASGSLTETRVRGATAFSFGQPVVTLNDTNASFTGSHFKSNVRAIVPSSWGTNADIFPSQPFVLMAKSNFFTKVIATTPRAMTNWSFSVTNLFGANTTLGIVTNHVAGYYRVNAVMNMDGDSTAPKVFRLRTFVNETDINPTEEGGGGVIYGFIGLDGTPSGAITERKQLQTQEVLYLNAGSRIEVRMGCDSGTPTVGLWDGRFMITKL